MIDKAVSPTLKLASLVMLGLVFVLVSGYNPTFFNSLSVYMVRPLADAGFGLLSDDWYASTHNPVALFRWLLTSLYRLPDISDSHGAVFVIYTILCGVYASALTYASARAFGYSDSPWLVALTAIVIVGFHGALAGAVVERISGIDVHTLFTKGVSGQSLVSAYLQPTTFVAFFMAAIVAFLADKRIWASIFILISVLFHPGYLYTGATLTLGMMLVLWRQEGGIKNAVVFGLITLALVLPVTIQVFVEFGEPDSVIRAEGHRILAVIRAPHHAFPSMWLRSQEAWMQMGLIAGAIFVSRRNALSILLAVPALITAILTIYVAVTNDYFVANIMPWRAFIFLVPLSTVTIVGFLISSASQKWSSFPTKGARILVAAGGLLTVLLAVNGGRNLIQASAETSTSPYHAVFNYARENSVKGDMYLVPPYTSGEIVSFAEFRVFAGVPVFVDEKSNPFAPRDMIEWWRRMQLVIPVFDNETLTNCDALQKMQDTVPFTHIASRADAVQCPGMIEVFRDANFVVYKRGE